MLKRELVFRRFQRFIEMESNNILIAIYLIKLDCHIIISNMSE